MFNFNSNVWDKVRIVDKNNSTLSAVYEDFIIIKKSPFKDKFKYTIQNDTHRKIVQSYS